MRTLTQVWFFLISFTFIFLVMTFQILGRTGLFIAFVTSLFFFYAALRNSLRLFKGPLNTYRLLGNDPTGFIAEIESNKSKFGLDEIEVHLTHHHCPPLVWKDHPKKGFVMMNRELLCKFNQQELRLFALFLLSHVECRKFVAPHVLSIVKIPIPLISSISTPLSLATHAIFKTQLDIFKADLKFVTLAETNRYEAGYFLNKLHRLVYNRLSHSSAYHFFSTLSFSKTNVGNEFGLPQLDLRLKRILGFALK